FAAAFAAFDAQNVELAVDVTENEVSPGHLALPVHPALPNLSRQNQSWRGGSAPPPHPKKPQNMMPITAAGRQTVKDGEMGLIRWRVKMSRYDADRHPRHTSWQQRTNLWRGVTSPAT